MYELLIHVDDLHDDAAPVRFGLQLARELRAFPTGVSVIDVVPSALALPEVAATLSQAFVEAEDRSSWWRLACSRHALKGNWEVVRGVYASALAHRSTMADLMVTRLPSNETVYYLGFDYLTRVLLSGASPMLLLPGDWQPAPPLKRVLIAWNSTLESMRALRAALPLLQRSQEVILVDGSVDPLPGLSPEPLPVMEWLDRNDIHVAKREIVRTDSEGAGEAILRHASQAGAELIVMGAWGHSRLSEWILGGATRYMLQHAQLPLLMAH